ncbi:MAG: LamG-like jellyroll fold domain-containing protein [Polyangia bacterium]
MNVAVSVKSVTFQNGYTSTVSGGTTAVAAGAWTMNTGTFTGAAGTVTISGDLSISGSGTFTGSSTSTQVAGSFTNAATFSPNGGTFSLVGTSPTGTITSGGVRLSSLTIDAAGGTYTLQDRLWVPGGTITLANGTLAGGANVIHAGAFSVGSGSFRPNTSTVVLDGSADTTLSVGSFSTLRIEDPTETNLVGYWKLDEASGTALLDSSGNAHLGTLASAGATRTTSSLPATIGFDDAGAVTFNGSSGFATLGGGGLPATNAAVTISAWVKLNSTATTQDFVVLTGGGNYVQLGLQGGKYAAWPSSTTTIVTGPAATTGAWHHVAYTYDGSSVDTIYVDGTATTGAFTHQSGATTAGYLASLNGGSQFLNGALDDVRIYSVALTASQIAQLAAGRYAGTGGTATVTLGANTTATGLLALDSGNLAGNGKTMTVTGAGSVNAGTYTVGSAAQSFSGGLTVNPNGVLTLASSGGSVRIGAGQTLAVDGSLNASSTGATIQSVSGTYLFKVGSTASATPTVNISGLAVKNTSDGMQIGAGTAATTTLTAFNNLAFSGGTGAQYLLVSAKTLFLSSNGCTFDAGQATGGTTAAVTLAGNGTADGETRAIFGGTTCAANWAASGSDTSCGTAAKSDDDSDNDGIGNNPSTNGAVVQFVHATAGDTAGSVIGFPTAAFDWNTFSYYSTYVAFHNASSGTTDIIYVRDESGNALYSWTVPTAGETITGTPQWITAGGKHYVYVATSQGHVYRLIDTATGTTSGSLALDTGTSWATNPFNCSCAITTPLSIDATNLYWGSTTSGKNFWTLGQSNESNPAPVPITPVVTSAGLSVTSVAGTSYAFLAVTGNVLKISTLGQSIAATNASPGSASIGGRIVTGYDKSGVLRVYAGDDAGTMWGLDAGTNFATLNGLWHTTTSNPIKSSPYYDHDTDTLQYGTQGGTIIVLNAGTGAALNAGYPYTPPGGAGDPITAAPLYYSGVLVVGSTGGKLYFLDRNTGTGVSLIKEYNFGSNQSVSGIGFDVNVNRYMVTTASSSSNDGRLYYFDLVSDPTNGSS